MYIDRENDTVDYDESVVKFEAQCHRVCLEPRSRNNNDTHVIVRIDCEDDGNWFKNMSFSSHWLPDLIKILETARDYMDKNCEKDPSGYGWKLNL